ncbi:hypothetical protein CRT60_30440 [Azospirillum palustre]|uniref:Uncharacterized protein n=2 Tax=Azospirillum palustre TaxID=2044885 RepID=A0A2B8B8W1_9PROT|nr:hypothetical protein CRT60_30440 [Azospirillum palustre]
MVRNLQEATVNDPKSQPRDRNHDGEKAAANQTAASQTAASHTADCTQYGQAAGSPGGRGGTSCYGGIQRVQPRTVTAATLAPDKDRNAK